MMKYVQLHRSTTHFSLSVFSPALLGDMGLDFAESIDQNLLKVVEPDGGMCIADELGFHF
jgi:hypothetical protein